MPVLKLGLPKGSLEKTTFELFAKAGYKIEGASRSYFPSIDDDEIECVLLRAQEMARYVDEGILDAGLTGLDWILENDADVVEVAELVYGKVGRKPLRWVVAVPQDSTIRSPQDLAGKRIATEAVGMTKRYLAKHGVEATGRVQLGGDERSSRLIWPMPLWKLPKPAHLCGPTICVFSIRSAPPPPVSLPTRKPGKTPSRRGKIERLAMMLQGVLAAEKKVGLMLNVAKGDLDKVLAILPALHNPTISSLADDGWYALMTIVDENVIRDIAPELIAAGAEGIVEYALNKIFY